MLGGLIKLDGHWTTIWFKLCVNTTEVGYYSLDTLKTLNPLRHHHQIVSISETKDTLQHKLHIALKWHPFQGGVGIVMADLDSWKNLWTSQNKMCFSCYFYSEELSVMFERSISTKYSKSRVTFGDVPQLYWVKRKRCVSPVFIESVSKIQRHLFWVKGLGLFLWIRRTRSFATLQSFGVIKLKYHQSVSRIGSAQNKKGNKCNF